MKKKNIFVIIGGILIILCGSIFLFWQPNRELKKCLKDNGREQCYIQFLQLGVNEYSAGNYQQALKPFKLSAAAFDNDMVAGFTVWRNIANTYFELEQYKRAKEIYNQLLEINHEDVKLVYLDYIRLYQWTKESAKALEVATEGFDRFGDTVYLYKVANILEDLARYEEEVKIYEQLLELLPENEDAILFKINRLKKVHNLE